MVDLTRPLNLLTNEGSQVGMSPRIKSTLMNLS